MKRITFICLLLLSVSFVADAATKTIKKTMNIGATIQVKPYNDGAGAYSSITAQQYSISDNTGISVAQQTDQTSPLHISYFITALKTGTHTLTVTQYLSNTTETYVVIYVITVKDPNEVVYATSVSLNKSDCNICVGGTQQLSATVRPINATNKTVSWQTNNFNVATVNSSGLVTGIGPGQALITATTQDGTNLTASCVINVKVPPTDIQLNHDSYQFRLLSSETLQLEAAISPSDALQEVSWSSSDTNVATVSTTGIVTPKGVGEATITATTTDGSNLTATCTITVLPPLATSIELNKTNATLETGKTLQLSATISPSNASQEKEWTSSNLSVATVDENGLVTAINEGNATITVSTKDGSGMSASCEISVVSIYASAMSLNQSSVNMHFGESSQLVATITPSDASQEVTWTSSDPSVVTVDEDGLLFAKSLGSATITATSNAITSSGENLSATCDVVVSRRYSYNNDVNRDGSVTAADVTALYDYLLTGNMTYISTSDVNDDGSVTSTDVTSVYEELLNGTSGGGIIVVEYEVNGVKFNMVKVEGGTFMMGATEEQGGETPANERPVHEVTLSSFFIGETEVTQELWKAVMGSSYFSNPSNHKGDLFPVEQVTWSKCNTFISNLNQMTGMTFRMPTEAEWEYAARGGQKSLGYKYSGSDNIDDVAWYNGNAGGATHEVKTKAPNELGIYDMSGNVWEWCQDIYGSYSADAQTNPTGATSGSYRVMRGGKYDGVSDYCRVSYRNYQKASYSHAVLGLRLVLSEE